MRSGKHPPPLKHLLHHPSSTPPPFTSPPHRLLIQLPVKVLGRDGFPLPLNSIWPIAFSACLHDIISCWAGFSARLANVLLLVRMRAAKAEAQNVLAGAREMGGKARVFAEGPGYSFPVSDRGEGRRCVSSINVLCTRPAVVGSVGEGVP